MDVKFFQKPTIYVGEVSINVTNLENSLKFYQHVVGFKVLEQSANTAILTADGEKPLLTLVQPTDVEPKSARTTGLYHFAILLPTRADLASFLRHLIQVGGSQLRLGAADHEVSEALYFDDPDGNGIEIARDVPSSEWKWTGDQVQMGTKALDGDGLLAEAKDEWEGLPTDTVMGHIHLHVSDLKETEKFYVEGLGYSIVTRYPGALFTSHNGYHHHIGLNIWNGEGASRPAKNSVGLNWYTLMFPDQATRQQTIDRLEKIGAVMNKEQDYYRTEDPSGNVIQLRVG